MMERRYINNLPLEEAQRIFRQALDLEPKEEWLATKSALGRITSRAILADQSSPGYNAAAMDGIAVISAETLTAREKEPLFLKPSQFRAVNTGNEVPFPFDAVIMKEEVTLKEGGCLINRPALTFQHIRSVGDDVVATELILPKDHKLRPFDLATVLSAGKTQLPVYAQPRVGILPTGSELVEDPKDLGPGKVLDTNSTMIANLVTEAGGSPMIYPPCQDDLSLLEAAVLQAAKENDLVLIGAGSSAGTKDFARDVLERLGQVLVHGIAMKPGKPTLLGKIGTCPVIGLPGYPVSTYVAYMAFADDLIRSLSRCQRKDHVIEARLSRAVTSSLKHEEFLRVTLSHRDGEYLATPIKSGAGVSMSLVRADGILTIPRNREGLNQGEVAQVRLLKDLAEINHRLSIIGSHDILLDFLSERLPLASSHVGSMGGVLAMVQGQADLAPIHLLEEASGSYNLHILKTYFPQGDHCLIKGPGRIQGLMVAKGNPLNIQKLADVVNHDFINRQRGSGTRLFLDLALKEANIKPEDISGYDREATTHTAVAAAVAQGTAQVGLGVLSAANALKLDFIPLGQEDYDFLVERRKLQDPAIMAFRQALTCPSFQARLLERGGYTIEGMGTIKGVTP